MRRVILAIAVAALGLSATKNLSAQDILRSMYSPVPVVNWTGFYAGGNFGYGWAKADSSASGVNTVTTSIDMKGLNAGGQIGANVQSGLWLVGIESDLQWSGQKSDGGPNIAAIFRAANVVPGVVTETNKVTWFGTTRARVGIAADQLLIFATAGVAYGQFKLDSTFGTAALGTFGETTTKLGWAAGGGVEAMLTRNWTVKAEYLHLDFGGFTQGFVVNSTIPVDLHTRLTNEVVRIGANYYFR